jgi:thioredoxin-related protein
MKTRFTGLLFLVIAFSAFVPWETNFSKALQQAGTEHKYVLLNFSGSDWCGPCINMHHEIFESADFSSFAGKNLVLVNADFPRQKKNQLPKELQKQNDALAEKYNKNGAFPLTVLLDEKGKILKQWEGYPKMSAADFVNDLKRGLAK